MSGSVGCFSLANFICGIDRGWNFCQLAERTHLQYLCTHLLWVSTCLFIFNFSFSFFQMKEYVLILQYNYFFLFRLVWDHFSCGICQGYCAQYLRKLELGKTCIILYVSCPLYFDYNFSINFVMQRMTKKLLQRRSNWDFIFTYFHWNKSFISISFQPR